MITRPSTVLRKARDIIAEGKWCKGAERVIGPDGDKFCAIGATAEAVGADWTAVGARTGHLPHKVQAAHDHADLILDEVVQHRTNHEFGSIVGYNDYKHRQRRHVLAVFDEAIEVAEAQEREARNEARRIARRKAALAAK